MIKILKTFYGFIWHYKKAFLIFIFVATIATIIENIGPYLYKLLVDAIPSKNYYLLLKIVIFFIGARIIGNLLSTLGWYLGDKVIIPAARDARIKIFRQVQDLDFAFHVNKNTGSLISAFKRGDDAFFSLFLDLNGDVFRVIIGLFVTLFFLNRLTPLFTYLMLGIFFVNFVTSWFLIRFNIGKRAAMNKAEDDVSGVITDNLINYETVKFFAKEKKEENRLRQEFAEWFKRVWAYANSFRLMDITIGTTSGLGLFLIFWIAIRKLTRGEMGTGDLVMLASFTTGFYWQFFYLLYKMREIAKKFIDIKRYFSLLDEKIMIEDPKNPVEIESVKGDLVFENVGFSYPKGKQNALVDFDFHIKPGEVVAFVGKSGAGKTTITKLLLRFYDVDCGQILLDGINIKDFTKSRLRSFFGVVPQEPILFNNTIGFNIGYGSEKPTKRKIVEAAKMANLHEFIKSLTDKYETQVGERGIKLSGGQKQRLAIARMLLVNPEIIIFDEATSNLDSESEKLIQEALWKIAKNRTVLIIAHRFSTVRKAGRIVVLEDGKIVQVGSHNKLIREKGTYRYLWQLQSRGKVPTDPELLV